VMSFYNTVGGRRFIDGTVPELVVQIKRVANALDRLIDLAEASRSGGAATPPPKKEGS
jgi:hypothetical protein